MISVIIPVYNLEAYIGRCINSVLSQTFDNFEVICVDDCSSDNSVQIIKRISSLDSRVKLYQHRENLGPAFARSFGYKNALGDYLFFLDGDDVLPPNALEVLYNEAVTSNSDLVRGCTIKIELDNSRSPLPMDKLPYGCDKKGIYRALLKDKFRHTLWATLYKRELLVNYSYKEYPNMRNGQDAYLFYQLVENINNGISIVPDIVYYYYMVHNSSTHIKKSNKSLEGLLVFHKYVTSIDFGDKSLTRLSFMSSTKCVKYHALRNGFSVVQKLIDQLNAPQFLSFKYTIKYMSFSDIVIFYIRWLRSKF